MTKIAIFLEKPDFSVSFTKQPITNNKQQIQQIQQITGQNFDPLLLGIKFLPVPTRKRTSP